MHNESGSARRLGQHGYQRVCGAMEVLRHCKDGVAVCNCEVSEWDELPPLQTGTSLAFQASGRCLRCQKDIDEQVSHGLQSHQIVALRSEDNYMDPLFRFPTGPMDDLKRLFDYATLTEAMLVALDHMQVNFVTISSSGFRKSPRNTLWFPQDLRGSASARPCYNYDQG